MTRARNTSYRIVRLEVYFSTWALSVLSYLTPPSEQRHARSVDANKFERGSLLAAVYTLHTHRHLLICAAS
jgi:hypothetical protein